jgi:hypothetical protein
MMRAAASFALAVAAFAPAVAGMSAQDSPPRRYAVELLPDGIAVPAVDGALGDVAWSRAAWSEAFVDIEGEGVRPPPLFATRFKALRDRDRLYLAAALEEPRLFATLSAHDSVIFHDPDFELFVDPEGDGLGYFELELNALGTTWDLRLDRPYWQGGEADNGWELEGLRVAIALDGTLNDARDIDQGWTVELALPWSAFRRSAPRPGESWRVNFSRVEWPLAVRDGRLEKVAGACEENWVWSPQGRIDMHRPERWGYFDFRP